MSFVYATHILNILFSSVLAFALLAQPRYLGSLANAELNRLFGVATPARNLMGSIYLSVVFVSMIALVWRENFVQLSIAIFLIQICYKFASAFMLRPTPHPLAVYNLLLMFINFWALWLLI